MKRRSFNKKEVKLVNDTTRSEIISNAKSRKLSIGDQQLVNMGISPKEYHQSHDDVTNREESHDDAKQTHSQNDTSASTIGNLTQRFIDASTDRTQVQGLTITDEQYREIKELIIVLRFNEVITEDICNIALNDAYNASPKSDTNPKTIKKLTQRIIAACTDRTQVQGLTITDEQYEAIKECLKSFKQNNAITDDIHFKSIKKAYNSRELIKAKKYTKHVSDEGRLYTTTYRSTEAGRKAISKYNSSDAAIASQSAYKKRRELLATPEGRQQIVEDYHAWQAGTRDLPDYVGNRDQFYHTFITKHQNDLMEAQSAYKKRRELLATPEGRQQIIEDYHAWHAGTRDLPDYVGNSGQLYEKFIKKKE